MPVETSDLIMIERAGVLHRATVAQLPGSVGAGETVEIDNITPDPADATDRFLVRRGAAAPNTLELLSDLTPTQLVALAAEIVAARGDRASLNNRLSTISNFASPNAGGVIVGQYYDNAFQGTGSSTLATAANRVDMAPFYTSQRMRIDQLGVAVSTASAGSLLRCFIYESGAEGWPDQLLYEGDSDLSGAATGYVSHSLDFTFDSGRQYWLGVRSSGTPTLRSINLSSAVNLGVNGNNGTQYFTMLRRTLAFATPLPASWGFVSGDRVANVTPYSIRMRAAAL